ncbi:unnamed protein product, partial [Sphacelaria rigidula]
QCFCGVDGDDPEALGNANCGVECSGNSSEICGGVNSISVYTY